MKKILLFVAIFVLIIFSGIAFYLFNPSFSHKSSPEAVETAELIADEFMAKSAGGMRLTRAASINAGLPVGFDDFAIDCFQHENNEQLIKALASEIDSRFSSEDIAKLKQFLHSDAHKKHHQELMAYLKTMIANPEKAQAGTVKIPESQLTESEQELIESFETTSSGQKYHRYIMNQENIAKILTSVMEEKSELCGIPLLF